MWQPDTGRNRYATPPASARANVSNVFATGLRMKGLEIFTDVSTVAYVCPGEKPTRRLEH